MSRNAKDKILETASSLYYEKGMKAVSFDEIAENCGITKSLIRYHFDSKALLAQEIYTRMVEEHRVVFFDKARMLDGGYTDMEILMAYRFQTVLYYQDDLNAFRFYTDLFSCSFTDVMTGKEDEPISPVHIPQEKKKMYFIGTQYASRGLIYHYIAGTFSCSWEEFTKYYAENTLGAVFSGKSIAQIHSKAIELLTKLDITYHPGFIWS